MTLEATLERIAAALEVLAENSTASATQLANTTPPPVPEADKPVVKRTSRAAKETPATVEPEKSEAPATDTASEAPAAAGDPVETPTTEAAPPAPSVEYKDVQAAATAYSQVGNRDGVMSIFADFGIKTLKDLKEAQYADIVVKFKSATEALQALGA